jgi:hypothetical protein
MAVRDTLHVLLLQSTLPEPPCLLPLLPTVTNKPSALQRKRLLPSRLIACFRFCSVTCVGCQNSGAELLLGMACGRSEGPEHRLERSCASKKSESELGHRPFDRDADAGEARPVASCLRTGSRTGSIVDFTEVRKITCAV